MNRRTVLNAAAAAAATLPLAPRPGLAQAPAAPWPSRSLRMVIPWPPGQSTDVQGRLIAQWLTERLGQTVVPENRPGAGGQIGTNTVAKAAPDGYTPARRLDRADQLPAPGDPHALRRGARAGAGGELRQNCLSCCWCGRTSRPPTCAPSWHCCAPIPASTRHNSSGVGGAQHLVTALFNAKAGIEALHVPFQGSGPALAALLGGQVHYGIDTPAAAWRLVQEGQLRALGITTGQPSRLLPGVPPIAAAGGPPDYDVGGWNGLMVPAGTPQPIIDRLVAEVKAGLATPALRRQFEAVGVEVEPQGPEEFLAQLRQLWSTFGPVIRQLGIRAE